MSSPFSASSELASGGFIPGVTDSLNRFGSTELRIVGWYAELTGDCEGDGNTSEVTHLDDRRFGDHVDDSLSWAPRRLGLAQLVDGESDLPDDVVDVVDLVDHLAHRPRNGGWIAVGSNLDVDGERRLVLDLKNRPVDSRVRGFARVQRLDVAEAGDADL